MIRKFFAAFCLTALLTACANLPVTPVNAPAQFFFPHGQNGPMLFVGETLIRAASWTRGDGIEFFSVKDGSPAYIGGLLSAGYVMDMVSAKDQFLYLATDYSILSVSGWQQGKPVILENHLISFPGGGVRHLQTDGELLYAATKDGIRSYRIMPDGRLIFEGLRPIKGTVTSMALTDAGICCITKEDPKTLITAAGSETFPFPIQGVYADGTEIYLLHKGQLINAKTKKELLPDGERALRVIPRGDNQKLDLITADRAKKIYRRLLEKSALTTLQTLPHANWTSHTTGNETYLADSVQWVKLLDRQGKMIKIPMVHGEAPVAICGDFVYSIDRQNKHYMLYGFNTTKKQNANMLPDLTLSWRSKPRAQFRYDIVIPPFAFYNYQDQYLFAPEALLDISDPAAPVIAAPLPDPAASIVEDNGRIYLAQGKFLSVLDAAKLPDVTPVLSFPATKAIPLWSDIAVQGDLLYVNSRNKLTIFRIEGEKLQELSSIPLTGCSYKMIRINDLLYFAPYGAKTPFRIVDVKDPLKPFIAAELEMYRGASILGIKYEGGKLYIASGRTITAYSLEDPLKPVPVTTWSGPDKAMQSYNYLDIRDGILAGKKYPRFDVWRVEE